MEVLPPWEKSPNELTSVNKDLKRLDIEDLRNRLRDSDKLETDVNKILTERLSTKRAGHF